MTKDRETHWERRARQRAVPSIDAYYNSYPGCSMLRAFDELLPNSLEDKNLCDVGCGVGYYFRYFRDRGAKEFVGVDVGKGLLEVAKKVNPFAKTVLARAESLPFPDEYFDIIICMGLVEHFENPTPVLQELTRVLKVGGTLIIETPNKLNIIFTLYKILNRKKLVWEHWWGPRDLIREIQKIRNLRFEKFTSSIIFAWYTSLLVDNKISRFLSLPKLISRIEHTRMLRNFGHLMFVAATKVSGEGSTQ